MPSKNLYATKGIIPIFSTSLRNNFIVKKAKIIDVKKPMLILSRSKLTLSLFKSIISKVNAPRIVGIASKNANFEASFRLNPIKRPAVIAAPDLEAPGIKAKHWNNPIKPAPKIVILMRVFLPLLFRKAKSNIDAKIKFEIAISLILNILWLIKSLK